MTAKLVRRSLILLIILITFSSVSAQTQPSAANPRNPTGHYQLKSGTKRNILEVQTLPGNKIKFHILALWVSPYNPENVHNGEVTAIVDLRNDTAIYEAENCRISIKFTGSRAFVIQAFDKGDCDFGANVDASGNYRKLNSRRPKFDF